jgi:hypothetical protein
MLSSGLCSVNALSITEMGGEEGVLLFLSPVRKAGLSREKVSLWL